MGVGVGEGWMGLTYIAPKYCFNIVRIFSTLFTRVLNLNFGRGKGSRVLGVLGVPIFLSKAAFGQGDVILQGEQWLERNPGTLVATPITATGRKDGWMVGWLTVVAVQRG